MIHTQMQIQGTSILVEWCVQEHVISRTLHVPTTKGKYSKLYLNGV